MRAVAVGQCALLSPLRHAPGAIGLGQEPWFESDFESDFDPVEVDSGVVDPDPASFFAPVPLSDPLLFSEDSPEPALLARESFR